MPTLILRFPGRRYHATPWGHHVNEGQIEWPPSPWRLLRALIATGYSTLQWPRDGAPTVARSLIEKLASVLPRYRLPPAAGAHSRHYMPLAKLKNGREDTTLVFDTWAQVDDGKLAVSWDVALSGEETFLLSELAERLGYMGRSESWVMARLAKPDEVLRSGEECRPCEEMPAPGRGWEQIPLMTPLSTASYGKWRQATLDVELAKLSVADASKKELNKGAKKVLAQRKKAEAQYPADLVACLQAETDWLRQCGWSQPPGSRRVFYWRKTDALEAGAPKAKPRAVTAPPVEAMLLSMATASGNDHALPSVTRTFPQAELLHRALVSLAERQGIHSRALTGCDESGRPLRGPHDHAHILPLDLDDDGHLDHILLWAPMGLNHRDQAAVRAVRQTFTKGGVGPLRLALAGSGGLSDLSGLPGTFGDGLRTVLGSHVAAKVWRSTTPFVPPRYLKKRGRNTIEGQIAAELASRNYPSPAEVRMIDPHEDERARQHRHFVRSRRYGPAAPVDCGFTVELRFSNPVRGPMCLGYGSHFGLGLFRPVSDARK
jgi:CRISPR-associated protein Csb2